MPSFDAERAARARASLPGSRALVLGLGREGIDLARFLAAHGAHVTVADDKRSDQLGEALATLADLPLGPPIAEARAATVEPGAFDLLYVSPGVPPEHPLVQSFRAGGTPVSSLVALFFTLCPAPIVGVTGSAGKTTTTALLGAIFREAGRRVLVGGNIGQPLLGKVDAISPEDWVVLELSSFQLEPLTQSPSIAVVTNVTPNHLDRHPSMEAYWRAKGQILAHQSPSDTAILNADDAWSRRYEPRGRVWRFSLQGDTDAEAVLRDGVLVVHGETLLRAEEVQLPGRHNLANALAASLAARAAGIDLGPIAAATRTFRGVPHRLQPVAVIDGVRWINDSIATAPERSIAALRSIDEPIVLLAGGRDKHLPMEEWARLIVQRSRHVVLFGEMGGLVREAIEAADPSYRSMSVARTMDEAVALAARHALPGDVVLLSPGGTSYDMYRDFEERGADFTRAVLGLGQPPRQAQHPDRSAA